MRGVDKKGQVWVETVIYTLIGLAVIGLVLAGALPMIEAKKDEVMIDQSITALQNIDNKVYEVTRAAGNRRVVNLQVKRGFLVVDSGADTISWTLDSTFAYSEIGLSVPFGNMNVTTTESGEYEVELKLGYKVDIRFENATTGEKQFDTAPTPYRLVIENVGLDSGNVVVDIREA